MAETESPPGPATGDFDIRPVAGHRILMDGMPGLIHSGDDFGINWACLALTETTITGFKGFDPARIPGSALTTP
jgi:hypothetical protein